MSLAEISSALIHVFEFGAADRIKPVYGSRISSPACVKW